VGFTFRPMAEADARTILGWHYAGEHTYDDHRDGMRERLEFLEMRRPA